MFKKLFLVFALAIFIISCGGGDTATSKTPHTPGSQCDEDTAKTVVCDCPDGSAGFQFCAFDVWSTCTCLDGEDKEDGGSYENNSNGGEENNTKDNDKQDGGTSTNDEEIEIKAVKPKLVNGKVGDKLTDGYFEITIHKFEMGYVAELSEFAIIFDIEVNNLLPVKINFYENFVLSTTLTPSPRNMSKCETKAEEYFTNIFSPKMVEPQENRRGLVVCPIYANEEPKNLSALYYDVIPYDLRKEYTSDSKFGEIKISIFTYQDIRDKMKSTGKIGEWVDNPFGWNKIRINSYRVESSIGTMDYSTKSNNTECKDDWEKACGGSLYNCFKTRCQFLVLNISVINKKSLLDSISSSSLEKYQLALRGVGYRRYNKSAYEMLDTPLDLTDMKSQDERTGELAFPISAHVDDYGGVEKNYHLEYSSFYNTIINDLNK